jgi:hypothetical protein
MEPARPFENSHFARTAKFPALGFGAQDEFLAYMNENAEILAQRALYEQSLGSSDPAIIQPGTCAPCLRPVFFASPTAGAKLAPNGKRVPDFCSAMRCDCPSALSGQQRAMLHFILANGLLPWTRILLAGPPDAVDTRIATLAGSVVTADTPHGADFHLAISRTTRGDDFAAMSKTLLPGGRLIFTTPFDPETAYSWDLLQAARDAGFREAKAYLYWSEELGYLGTQNWIFRAIK